MASNHSFIQGGVSTLPSFLGIKKPRRIGDYEQAIVIILIDNQSFFFLLKITSVSSQLRDKLALKSSYYYILHVFVFNKTNTALTSKRKISYKIIHIFHLHIPHFAKFYSF
jgi:hypothetical protein